MSNSLSISKVIVKDVRFPTSLDKHGSDAMHTDPDYSCAYVILETTDKSLEGHGLTFTIGRGTEVVCKCIESLAYLVINKNVNGIFNNFGTFWRSVTSESQLRWIGPEKGVIHLASSAIINALWDLWAKIEGKPLWKLLADMDPVQLVNCIDFRYITDVITRDEAVEMLRKGQKYRKEREDDIKIQGYPAYTTTVGWLGYSDEKVSSLCKAALLDGYTRFKVKVGDDVEFDKKRLKLIRNEIGPDSILMVDANQKWDVKQAIEWMKQLKEFNILWIEEPTAPDDVIGHSVIAKELAEVGIGVATGEQAHNRIIFKQLLQSKAISFCQIDSTRLGGVNEVMAVILMAHKFRGMIMNILKKF